MRSLRTATPSPKGGVGVGYNIPFFMIAIMPFIYVQTTDQGQFSWYLGARIQY